MNVKKKLDEYESIILLADFQAELIQLRVKSFDISSA